MQQVILTLVLVFSSILISKAQDNVSEQFGTIEVSVKNALNDEGTIHFALFNKENFNQFLAKGHDINYQSSIGETVMFKCAESMSMKCS